MGFDMTESTAPKGDQMNAEDFVGGPRTFTIAEVREGSSADQPFWFYLAEFPRARPFKPSKTARRMIILAWGSDTDNYIGKRFTLYCDPDVHFGGKAVGGIRISHVSGIDKPIEKALAVRRGQREVYRMDPLPDIARPPSPVDQLVWEMNAARIPTADRLAYCIGIVQHDLRTAHDLTPAELARVIAALQEQTSASIPPAADIASEQPYEPPSGELTEEELAAIADRELGEPK